MVSSPCLWKSSMYPRSVNLLVRTEASGRGPVSLVDRSLTGAPQAAQSVWSWRLGIRQHGLHNPTYLPNVGSVHDGDLPPLGGRSLIEGFGCSFIGYFQARILGKLADDTCLGFGGIVDQPHSLRVGV